MEMGYSAILPEEIVLDFRNRKIILCQRSTVQIYPTGRISSIWVKTLNRFAKGTKPDNLKSEKVLF